jgi:uncharacterized protein (TIGR03067 family)
MRYLALGLLALVTTCGVVAAAGDAAETPDAKSIQGTWEFVSIHDQGKQRDVPAGMRAIIKADALSFGVNKDDSMGCKYTIDPAKTPKQMDWFVEEDPGRPLHQPGIYKLEGDTLTVCMTAVGKPRPIKFESKAGDFAHLWVLKRVKDAK